MPDKAPDRADVLGARPPGDCDQSGVEAFLACPKSYPSLPGEVERLETHGALIFLAGDEAYKIKRPVRFSYMDFSTLEKRRQAIEHELEINRPHAPDLYVAVIPITREPGGGLAIGGTGAPVEWALRMRRFDQGDLLGARAGSGQFEPVLCRQLADRVAAFHRTARPDRGTGSPAQMRAVLSDVATALETAAGKLPGPDVGRFRVAADRDIARTEALLDSRTAAGFVRRCHGDLHLGNIVLWKGEPVLFDAIEFDDRLATIDVLYDLAFLLMDLCHRGQRPAANAVLNRYIDAAGDDRHLDGLAALPLFLALRAGVRAMVAVQRAAQQNGRAAERGFADARAYLAAAIDFLAPAPPRLVAIGGLSGTGKSTLGAALAPGIGRAPGAIHLRSDVERKALFGVPETKRLPPGAYTREAGEQVYTRLATRAGAALRAGHSVVADAVHARAEERAAIETVAGGAGADFTGLWLEAPAGTLMSRVEARRGDASDATRDVVAQQLDYDTGPVVWKKIDAGGGASATLTAAREILEQASRAP